MADDKDRVAHHIVEYTAALEIAHPKPRFVRATMFLRGACQVGPARRGSAAGPQNISPSIDRGRENLVFHVGVWNLCLHHESEKLFRFLHVACERLLTGDSL